MTATTAERGLVGETAREKRGRQSDRGYKDFSRCSQYLRLARLHEKSILESSPRGNIEIASSLN